MPPSGGTPIEVLVIFYSRYGMVRQLAERIAEGVQRVPECQARLLEVDERPIEAPRPGETESDMLMRRAAVINQLHRADAWIIGSPTYFGSMASPLKRLVEDCAAANPPPTDRSRPWLVHRFRDKVGAAFTASGTPHGGNEETLHSMLTMMMHLGMLVVTPGQGLPILENPSAPYGVTAIAGAQGAQPIPDDVDAAALALGERVARITSWLTWGRTAWSERYEKDARE